MSARNRARRVKGATAKKRAVRRGRKLRWTTPRAARRWTRTSGSYPDSAVLVHRASAKRERRNARRLATWTGRR